MAVKIPESTLPTRDLEPGDYIRVVGSDGKSAKIPRTGIDGLNVDFQIDDAMSNISENPVQNKVINSAINALYAKLTTRKTYTKTDIEYAANTRTVVNISKADLGITSTALNIIPIAIVTGSGFLQATVSDISNSGVSICVHNIGAATTKDLILKYLEL